MQFTLETRAIDDTSFNVYGNGDTISTVVAVVGDQSGLRKEFMVNINKNSSSS